jgi:hypothetical protein
VTATAKGLLATASGLMVVGKANPDEEVLRSSPVPACSRPFVFA